MFIQGLNVGEYAVEAYPMNKYSMTYQFVSRMGRKGQSILHEKHDIKA